MTFYDTIQKFAILTEHITGENWRNVSDDRVSEILNSISELTRIELPEGFKIPFWLNNAYFAVNKLAKLRTIEAYREIERNVYNF